MQSLSQVLKLAEAIPPSANTECWCGGKGGRDPVYFRLLAEPVYRHVCVCQAGKVAAFRRKILLRMERSLRREERNSRLGELRDQQWVEAMRGFARFAGMTLGSSPLRVLAAQMATTVAAGQSWYLWGPTGVGKTCLAVGYLRAFLDATDEPRTVLFRTVPGMLQDMRDSMDRRPDSDEPRQGDLMALYRGVDLLVMDDLGAEHIRGSGWPEERLYLIIGSRHGDLKPTVFTSNLSLQAVGARIGNQTAWRIEEACGDGIKEVRGPNLRDVR